MRSGVPNITDSPYSQRSRIVRPPKKIDLYPLYAHILDGYPGEYVLLARRKGTSWFITGINAGAEPVNIKTDVSYRPTGQGT